MNGGDVYIFDNIVRTLFTVSGEPALISKPQENQVARSQIKHADEHRRPNSDPCLRGCFSAAEPRSQLTFLPLLPCLPAINGAAPTLSMH